MAEGRETDRRGWPGMCPSSSYSWKQSSFEKDINTELGGETETPSPMIINYIRIIATSTGPGTVLSTSYMSSPLTLTRTVVFLLILAKDKETET